MNIYFEVNVNIYKLNSYVILFIFDYIMLFSLILFIIFRLYNKEYYIFLVLIFYFFIFHYLIFYFILRLN